MAASILVGQYSKKCSKLSSKKFQIFMRGSFDHFKTDTAEFTAHSVYPSTNNYIATVN